MFGKRVTKFFLLILIFQSTIIKNIHVFCIDESLGLGAGITRVCPDGSIIEVNGVILSDTGNVVGWIYDWGDGSQTTGYFSTFHKYSEPGIYNVTITGYEDTGNVKKVFFIHEYSEIEKTDVSRVELSNYSLGIKSGENVCVDILAYNNQGNMISLMDRNIEVFNPVEYLLDVELNGSSLIIKAKELDDRDYGYAFLYVYVDKQEAIKPLNIIINWNKGDFTYVYGDHNGLFLPDDFFKLSISPDELVGIIDRGYQLGQRVVGNSSDGRPLFQGVSYAPPVYGVNGNPLGLGDYALPVDGVPRIGVILHEMGHNFHGRKMLFNCIGIPGPFYQETLAEWFAQYAMNTILNDTSIGLGDTAIEALEEKVSSGIEYHDYEYNRYVSNGKQFNYDDISASHALVKKVFDYSILHGWDNLESFFTYYDLVYIPSYTELVSVHGGLCTENRVTLMVASLSAVFGEFVKQDLTELNFPVNDALYNDLMLLYSNEPSTVEPDSEPMPEPLKDSEDRFNQTSVDELSKLQEEYNELFLNHTLLKSRYEELQEKYDELNMKYEELADELESNLIPSFPLSSIIIGLIVISYFLRYILEY